ncbi:MAG: hypothetical protein J6K28_02780 [Alistipes sp.]|nr:hypothetical protein [Alistipes sp.]
MISTLALSLALCGISDAVAQNARPVSKPASDTVLLSQSRDGDYMVRRYLVKSNGGCNSDFAVRYRINLSTMSPSLSDNGVELSALNAFIDSLATDSMMHVRSVTITGYASPDGTETANMKLAHARAADFKKYLDNKYGLSSKYDVRVDAVVDGWDSCIDGIEASNLAQRKDAVAIIRSNDDMSVKQRKLKSMKGVWNYLASNVLPPLRQADIEFDYGRDDIAETRVLVARPVPAAPAATATLVSRPATTDKSACPCGCAEQVTSVVLVEDMTNGLIIEMGEVDIDY